MVDLRAPLFDIYLRGMKEGYSEDAREVLGLIASYLEDGLELPTEAKEFLIAALKDINGSTKSADAALKLNQRKNKSKMFIDIELARAVHWSIEEGKTLEQAYVSARESTGHHYSDEKIRAAYYHYKEALEMDCD